MKIEIHKIPSEGMTLTEEIPSSTLDIDTDIIKLKGPVRARAEVSKITNAVHVDLFLEAGIYYNCSRCLEASESELKKSLKLNYPVDKGMLTIDLDPDIREEIILDYPIKSLCNPDCRGLCAKCGANLNKGSCNC